MPLPKVARFIIAGGTSAVVNLGSLYILVQYFSVYYLTGSVLAFIISLLVSFSLQKFWTFRDHATDGMHRQFCIYALIAVINLGLNTLIVFTLVEGLGTWYLLAQIIAGILVAIASYFSYHAFVFHQKTALLT